MWAEGKDDSKSCTCKTCLFIQPYILLACFKARCLYCSSSACDLSYHRSLLSEQVMHVIKDGDVQSVLCEVLR